jgi:hypothetical protein
MSSLYIDMGRVKNITRKETRWFALGGFLPFLDISGGGHPVIDLLVH